MPPNHSPVLAQFGRACRRWLAIIAFVGAQLAPGAPAGAAEQAAPAPRIGLVLSGGGARGGAHIGVLRVLEQAGIPIDCIAGTSFGALVGGFYALGYSADEIERIFVDQDWNELFSDAPDRRLASLEQRRSLRYQAQLTFRELSPELPTGMWSGQKLSQVFDRYTTERMLAAGYDFDRLPIPFRTVATDLVTGKPYVFRRGRMTEALRASIAIPMLFTPVSKDDMLLVDGGLVDNLPSDLAREMGADIIIAVDVTAPLAKKERIRTFLDVMDQTMSLMMRQSIDSNTRLVNLMLRPDLEGFTNASYPQLAEIVPRGERAARERLDDIRRLTGDRTRRHPAPAARPATQPVIDSVSFDGLANVSSRQLEGEVKARVNEPVDVKVLGADVSRLYATQLFEGVDYELQPSDSGRYHLRYKLRESSPNRLGASIRYDRDYKLVALAELTARQLFNSSTSATISSQFGGLENHFASMRIRPPAVTRVFVEPKVYLRRRERRDVRGEELVDKFTEKRLGGQLMLGGMLLKGLEISGGYRNERVAISGGTSPNRQESVRRHAGLEFRLQRDSLDRQDFPRAGGLLSVEARKFNTGFGGDFDYSTLQLDLQRHVGLSERTTLGLRGAGAFSRGDLPFYERFYIGGYNFSEGGPRQLLGYGRDELAARQAALLGVSLRREVFSRHLSFIRHGYLSLFYNVAGVSARQEPTYLFNLFNVAGVEFALDSLLGPLRVAGGWGEEGRFKFYLSLGPGF
jgi:NTE family protein